MCAICVTTEYLVITSIVGLEALSLGLSSSRSSTWLVQGLLDVIVSSLSYSSRQDAVCVTQQRTVYQPDTNREDSFFTWAPQDPTTTDVEESFACPPFTAKIKFPLTYQTYPGLRMEVLSSHFLQCFMFSCLPLVYWCFLTITFRSGTWKRKSLVSKMIFFRF